LKQSVLIYGTVVASLGGLVAVVSISQKQTKRHVVPWSAFDRCNKAMSESIQDLDWKCGLMTCPSSTRQSRASSEC
jgi:hypothetical protein